MTRRILVLIVLLSLSSSVFAQRFTKPSYFRSSQWEFSLLFTSEGSQTNEFDNGASLDIESKTGWGFSIGYNWNAHINLQYKFSTIKPGYTATIVPEDGDPLSIDHKLTKNSNQINATWNILARKFTPFIQAGAGWTKLDSNILSVPPVTGCWWDPWWGYVCSTTWDTYSTTRFSYNVGLGVRWDITRHWFTRAAYNREWVDSDNKMEFDTITVDVGWRF
jgi:opacity protein-like surface antigen